jgi:hypothetical protein
MTVVGFCNIAITLIDPDRANAPNPDKNPHDFRWANLNDC